VKRFLFVILATACCAVSVLGSSHHGSWMAVSDRHVLRPGDWLSSDNGVFHLIVTDDGDLQLYYGVSPYNLPENKLEEIWSLKGSSNFNNPYDSAYLHVSKFGCISIWGFTSQDEKGIIWRSDKGHENNSVEGVYYLRLCDNGLLQLHEGSLDSETIAWTSEDAGCPKRPVTGVQYAEGDGEPEVKLVSHEILTGSLHKHVITNNSPNEWSESLTSSLSWEKASSVTLEHVSMFSGRVSVEVSAGIDIGAFEANTSLTAEIEQQQSSTQERFYSDTETVSLEREQVWAVPAYGIGIISDYTQVYTYQYTYSGHIYVYLDNEQDAVDFGEASISVVTANSDHVRTARFLGWTASTKPADRFKDHENYNDPVVSAWIAEQLSIIDDDLERRLDDPDPNSP